MEVSLEKAEKILLDQVKFVNLILQQCRERNKFLKDEIGMTYAKLVGLGTPYEEAIYSIRKVKNELDACLKSIRQELIHKYNRNLAETRKKSRKK